ncbi:MAG: crossover junction endodeoxyribonuclease RuvC [Treponema sp.]
MSINDNLTFNSLPGTKSARPFPEKQRLSRPQIRRILGIDPGLASTGFGIVDGCMNKYRMVSYGVIETPAHTEHGLRLLTIYNQLLAVINEFRPDEASMETLYFARNVSSAMGVAEARGVATLCLAQNAIPLFEYKPNQIKLAVTGGAQADKALVEKYVKLILNLKTEPKPDHAADALAGAVTHLHYSAGF